MSHTFFVKFQFLKAALHKECLDKYVGLKFPEKTFCSISPFNIRSFFLRGEGGGRGSILENEAHMLMRQKL